MMKLIPLTLLTALIITPGLAQAGLIVGGTRLIYDGSKKESSINVSNPDQAPYLVQSWVEPEINRAEKTPFVITPPLFRLDGGQENVLRVVRAGGNLPQDRESLYWLNIKSIPSIEKDQGKNLLQIAVKTRIKLIYRPEGLTGSAEVLTQKLSWQRRGNRLEVSNPTSFYMNFQSVTVAGKELEDARYIAPQSSAIFELPSGAGNSVSWKIINDYGGIGELHRASF